LNFKICKTIILPVILYGCETWSLTLKEEQRLRMLENMVLRRIFGPKGKEVEGSWRRLHNEEFHNLYASSNVTRVTESRRMRWAGHAAHMGQMRNSYKIFVGKPVEKRPLGRSRRRWENIRMYL
jgi:hypothetical protein